MTHVEIERRDDMDGSTTLEHGAVVAGGSPFRTEQGTVYTPGISAQTVGAKGVFLGIAEIAPGERTRAHIHDAHESAFYLLSGEGVELWTGPALEFRATARAGDFLFIPAGVPHVAVNRHPSLPAVFIGVRNDPNANERVTMRPDLDANVP
jgi:uncharacterized RmlC-like cupin family protein